MFRWVLCFLCTHRWDCGSVHKKRYRTGLVRSHVTCRRVSEHDCAGREERRLPQPNQRTSALGKRTRALKFGLSNLLEGGRAARITHVYSYSNQSDSKQRSVLLSLTARRPRAAWKLKI
jgi:hypothetical protein